MPDPAITRLNDLADVMADPVTLVGANGLAHPVWEAYQPSAVALFVRMTAAPPEITPSVTKDGIAVGPFPTIYVPDLHKTGWPFGATPDTIGVAFAPYASNDRFAPVAATYRCAFLANADAMSGIASLPDAGESLAASEMAAGGSWAAGGERWDNVDLVLRAIALMPEDVAGSCAEALA